MGEGGLLALDPNVKKLLYRIWNDHVTKIILIMWPHTLSSFPPLYCFFDLLAARACIPYLCLEPRDHGPLIIILVAGIMRTNMLVLLNYNITHLLVKYVSESSGLSAWCLTAADSSPGHFSLPDLNGKAPWGRRLQLRFAKHSSLFSSTPQHFVRLP